MIRNCRFTFTKPCNGALGYNTGPAVAGKILGREPLQVEDCQVVFALPEKAEQGAPAFFVAGHVAAPVVFTRCSVQGLKTASTRGDGAVFANNANPVAQPASHIRFVDCFATDGQGKAREFIVKRN